MRKMVFGSAVFGAVAALALLAGCTEEKSERGLEALPDMFHTPAHKALTGQQSADGTTQYSSAVMPVEGTVPRSGPAYAVGLNDWEAAKKLANPLTPSVEVLRTGARWFTVTCATCHGRDGNAVHANIAKQFAGIPSLNGANILAKADGEIYHIISVGRGRMPNLLGQLPPAERWSVVTYVRLLARATAAAKDAKDLIGDAESVIREHPADAAAQAQMEQGRTVLAQREADLKAILAMDEQRDALIKPFAPLPEPVPEYLPPTWHNPGEGASESAHGGGHQ